MRKNTIEGFWLVFRINSTIKNKRRFLRERIRRKETVWSAKIIIKLEFSFIIIINKLLKEEMVSKIYQILLFKKFF